MKSPLDLLGDLFGASGGAGGGLQGGYQWEHYGGTPEWQQRIQRQSQMQGMMNQQAQQQRDLMQQYYHGQQTQIEPSLDPEWHTTQVLTLLFGEHWELINEQIRRLSMEKQ